MTQKARAIGNICLYPGGEGASDRGQATRPGSPSSSMAKLRLKPELSVSLMQLGERESPRKYMGIVIEKAEREE